VIVEIEAPVASHPDAPSVATTGSTPSEKDARFVDGMGQFLPLATGRVPGISPGHAPSQAIRQQAPEALVNTHLVQHQG
jgi:hypothetical protein